MLERREFLARMMAAGGVVVSAPMLAWLGADSALAAGGEVVGPSGSVFSAGQRRAVEAAADTILPKTATPGALDAGVPDFVEMMVAEWYSPDERAEFLAGVARLDAMARARGGADFASLAPAGRTAILEELQGEGAALNPATAASSAGSNAGPPSFFAGLKEMVVVGFFTSEVGAPLVGGDEIIPGRHVGCDKDGPGAPGGGA